ncbi:MAG: hypothetical protein CFK52_08675 [Chloracidobacterium sp. CP2_5A]|nr:MAG: hypothetical protein CFK52_08675 [Chloracidobacterium sp. CP2_5A]
MPSLPGESQLDNPLYGDFEDYLDGALPEARRQEVEAFLARSPTARALLDELVTARAWLRETNWDVPEPARWPAAEAILARAGHRPASASAAKSRRANWRGLAFFPSPAWALSAAAGLALLMGGGLLWRMLGPSSSDEVAQSSRSQPPEAVAPPTISAPAPAAPPLAERPPAGGAPKKGKPEKPLLDAAPASAPAPLGQAEPAPPAASAPAARAPSAAGEAPSRAERDSESRNQAPAAGAPSAQPEARKEAWKARSDERPSPAAVRAPDDPGANQADAMEANESLAARSRSSVADAAASAPVTLRFVVADRSRAAEQATAVARALGGAARLSGERLIIAVPAARVAECAARLRSGISTTAEGQPLLVTVRAQE